MKKILCIICAAILFFHCSLDVFAINTKFNVPTIEQDWTPDNCLYKSPNLNIMVCKWSYGLVADLLNTSNVDTLLSELHANISPAGYKRSVLGIYMEGAGLSAGNVSAIQTAGWTEVELYYETFLVGGSAPTAAMTPAVEKAEDESAKAVLTGAGITENVAMFVVSDVNMSWANIILYEPEFKFLKGKTLYSYKFINDLGVFVPIQETYFGAYAANFLELYDLQNAEANVNGIYVTVTESLPEELVVSADQISSLRESLSVAPPTESVDSTSENTQEVQDVQDVQEEQDIVQSDEEETIPREPVEELPDESEPTEESKPVADETLSSEEASDIPDVEELALHNTEQTVAWKFADGQAPDNFTPEATVEAVNEAEVSVEFAFSGELPEGTEVTIEIPRDHTTYEEGDTLYFYFCNPQTGNRDFISEGQYRDEKVTFKINHCSEYVITTVGPEEIEQTEKSITIWPVVALPVIMILGLVGFLIYRKKNQNK